ncbi:hypothetical protein CPB83DRAFT_841918 [Crepidotus variabilis]|uniref:Uncharacterized protein n=1 Tax=Crepidotus variabilis TaxID=179855 RepID=A0A9P6EV22_9AGAR|nr:hypothetical protein CPB83DRAFT_841918 [Crepidotus variabilis]
MAEHTSEILLLPETSGKEVKEKVVEREGGVEDGTETRSAEDVSSSTLFVAGSDPQGQKGASSSSTTTADAQQNGVPSRPSLVPLGSGHAQSSSSPPVAPQPKRFSAVNINKKFLEKNIASGSSNSTSSSSTGLKSGNPSARPAQPTSSHSRLVTTKLTASPGVSSVPAGWSRPSSVAPSPAPGTNSPGSSSPLPTATPSAQPSTTTAPPLAHVGKVIQPQPRAAIAQLVSSKENGSGKPVWGNVKPGVSLPTRQEIITNDFPTAAEVANANRKLNKPEDPKAPSKVPSNQLRSEEVDTFRGVHLDPNAHHWGEEQEDDDDNFLDGVIEFGDGRQYKVDNLDIPIDGKDLPVAPVSRDERFADDFDRSWPKSREPPPPPLPKDLSTSSTHSTSPKSHSAHSPQDSSRVLFNERSNRLEPYNQSSYRPLQGSTNSKRMNSHEANGDPSKGPRDISANVQVLQKPSNNEQGRSRRFSNTSNGYAPPMSNGVHAGHRRDGAPPSPRMIRDLPPHSVDAGFADQKSRRTSMGPPPLPPHAGHRDGRQPPPHLSPNAAPRRLSFRDSHPLPSDPPLSASLSSPGRIPPHSPAASHASFSTLSPTISVHAQLPGAGVDIEEARKDVMHTAAERAKARRQQEEADREAQKERARRKAAEIEEKMKAIQAAEAEKTRQKAEEEASRTAQELEAIAMIEEAVKGVNLQQDPPQPTVSSAIPPVQLPIRRPSISARQVHAPVAPTPASRAESWRGRQVPQSPSTIKRAELREPASIPSSTFASLAPSAVEQVASIADATNDELEIVDFTEMGKFVGVVAGTEKDEDIAKEAPPLVNLARPARPSASDFFEETAAERDSALSLAKKADYGAWRKKVEVSDTVNAPSESKKVLEPAVTTFSEGSTPPKEDITHFTPPETPLTKDSPRQDHSPGQILQASTSFTSQRTPIRSQFKEAPMSALDDTMSRIKGALSGMQIHETMPKVVLPHAPNIAEGQHHFISLKAPRERWLPQALRAQAFDEYKLPRESFLVTIEDLSLSPPPIAPSVKLPSVSRRLEPVPKPQLIAFHRFAHDRGLTILSLPGLSLKSLLVNDVLFRGPPASIKGRSKYFVLLPGYRNPKTRAALPSPKINGAFGRPTAADGVSSWRKPVKPDPIEESPFEVELNTLSRSPPPENTPPQAAVISVPRSSETSPSKSDGSAAIRRRSQPKMPEGSSVAFRRDSKIDVVMGSPKVLVNFIVGSELEESARPTIPGMSEPGVITASRVIHSPLVPKPELNQDTSKTPTNGSVFLAEELYVSSPTTRKEGDTSVDHGLATSHAPATWTRSPLGVSSKDTPSRAPNPEHLKAVWSQSSSKADINTINSLEAIADDLTTLPFVLAEGKAAEAATPPPTSAPSRMSIRDVTKAFQQVPTSSSTQGQSSSREKVPISPPTTNAPVARPTATPSYTYSPLPQNNARPAYGPYPSPMMTHSPGPVMYGHPMAASPVPSRMPVNGQQPMYNSMWMAGPTPQAPGNVLRPVGPPYHPQMMAYPTPGYVPQPLQPHPGMMPPPTPPTQQASRGRGMPVMSPVMSPAHAHHYGATPVLMHTPQNHGYMPMPASRGQLRPENGHMHPQHRPPQHPHATPTHPGYTPGPASPYARPW